MDVDSIRNQLEATCPSLQGSEAHLPQGLVEIRGLMGMAGQVTEHSEQANQLAPISSLPDELLLMIFKKYRNQPTKPEDKMRCAIVLSHVTSHWHRLSMAESCLWSIVAVADFRPLEFYDMFWERSGQHLLDIYLSPMEGLPRVFEWEQGLDHLSQHIGRWQVLNIYTKKAALVNSALKRVAESSTPFLKQIYISCFDYEDPESFANNVIRPASSCTPALLSLDLSYATPFRFLPSFQTLMDLTLCEVAALHSSRLFFDVLHEAASLTTLSLFGQVVIFSGTDDLPTIQLHSLVFLQILPLDDASEPEAYFPDNYISRICTALSTPALRCLRIPFKRPSMISCFSNSLPIQPLKYPLLDTIDITEGLSGAESAKHLMRALPTVTHVALLLGVADTLLRVLLQNAQEWAASSAEASPLWPRLCTIIIRELTDGSLRHELVQARLAIGHPLKVCIGFHDH